jgi:phage gp36-like protein
MPYATQQDFINAFQEREAIMLTNLDRPNAIAVDSAPLNKALADASALIDDYCGQRYLLPLSPLPVTVNRYCLDIARYMLDRIRSREDVRLRYEDAIKFLEKVAKGLVSLGANAAGVGVSASLPSNSAAGARTCVQPPIDMGGYDYRGY